jgi:hypothetical protein
VVVLRIEDHMNGDSYWLRSGNVGIGSEPLSRNAVGRSSRMGVSKVKYWYVIDCSFGSLSREVLGPLSFLKLDPAVKLCLSMPVMIVEFCLVLFRDVGISSLVSVAIMDCEVRRQHQDRIVPTNWRHFKVSW